MKLVELAEREAPACWSWPLPDMRPPAEVAELLAEYELPAHICSNAVSGPAAAWRFIEFHAGRCAVYGDVPGLLVVDHKHGPRTIRGCLCYGCNMLEGRSGHDLPVFVGYRREHPALMLGYYEPYRVNGASQRVLRAVHAAVRAQRYRELRIADVTRSIRLMTQDPDVRADDLLSSKIHQLSLLWQIVAKRPDGANPELVHDLAVFHAHLCALPDIEVPSLFETSSLAPLADLVARLHREYAQMMGGEPDPLAAFAGAKARGGWVPPWERQR